jgi:hypothetical protein
VIKILLQLVGLLIVVGGVGAVWFGFERIDEARGLEQNITAQRSQNVRRSAEAKEEGLKKIAEFEQGIEAKKMERNLWFGVALVALVAGLGFVLGPSSRKRKTSAVAPTPAPSQIEEAPGPLGSPQ